MTYTYKGAISFGLIYIPIMLSPAIKNNDISFNLLDKKTKSRVQYKKTCVDCDNKEIKQEDIIKGYEYEDDKYVLFSEEDFEKIKTKKDKTITIIQFADLKEIDPLYYEKAFYVIPNGAENAFQLLMETMEEENKVGIAKCVINHKENLIVIRAKNHEMFLNTLYFEEEVQKNPTKISNKKIEKQELQMAKTLINSMTKPFDITQYKDEYKIKLQKAIENKIAGKEIAKIREPKIQSSDDLMEALKKSLSSLKKNNKIKSKRLSN